MHKIVATAVTSNTLTKTDMIFREKLKTYLKTTPSLSFLVPKVDDPSSWQAERPVDFFDPKLDKTLMDRISKEGATPENTTVLRKLLFEHLKSKGKSPQRLGVALRDDSGKEYKTLPAPAFHTDGVYDPRSYAVLSTDAYGITFSQNPALSTWYLSFARFVPDLTNDNNVWDAQGVMTQLREITGKICDEIAHDHPELIEHAPLNVFHDVPTERYHRSPDTVKKGMKHVLGKGESRGRVHMTFSCIYQLDM